MGGRVAIAATGPVSLAAGREVALAGGNAVDVAVAAALAAMSTEPGIVSLAGGAFVSVWPAAGEPGRHRRQRRDAGPRACPPSASAAGCTRSSPTTAAACGCSPGTARSRRRARSPRASWPSRSSATLSVGRRRRAGGPRPAATATRSAGAAARYLSFIGALALRPRPRRPPGRHPRRRRRPVVAGDVVTNHALADVLDLVAHDGASVLTTGEIGRAMVDDMAAHGGLVTHLDLAEYTPLVRPPVRRTVGDWDLAVNPPPSVGGPMLAVMLGELAAPRQLALARHHRHPALGAALPARRARPRARPRRRRARAAARRRPARPGRPADELEHRQHLGRSTATAPPARSPCRAATAPGITVPGTGMLLNNALGEPELNKLGLHRLAPGTRLASNMAPTTGPHRRRPGARHRLARAPTASRRP